MAEPRARVARHKGQMNFPSERMYFFYSAVSLFEILTVSMKSVSFFSPTETQALTRPSHLSLSLKPSAFSMRS